MFTLPREDQALIDQLGFKRKLADVDNAILANAAFLNQIVAHPEIFENGPEEEDEEGLGEENVGETRDEGLLANRYLFYGWRTLTSRPGDGDRGPAPHDHSHPPGHSHEHTHPHSHEFFPHPSTGQENPRRRPTDFDMDKVRSTLKQLVRDWSEEVSATTSSRDKYSSKNTTIRNFREGKKERQATSRSRTRYLTTSRISPWRKGMENPRSWHASSQTKSRHDFRVLVPGAGLGRLAYDVAKLGRFLSFIFHFRDRFSVRLFVSGKRVFTLHVARLVLYS